MNRTALAKHIRARLSPLAEDLADLLWSSVETQIAEVLDVARSALLSDWTPEVEAVPIALVVAKPPTPGDRAQPPDAKHEPDAPSRRKPAKERPVIARSLPTPEPVDPLVAKSAPLRHCRKCGAIGFRSDGCGRTHNVKPEAAPASDDEDSGAAPEPEEPRRPGRPRRSDAPAAGLPVIPHLALVAMLATDRAATAGGDAGGFVARPDREPSLVGYVDSLDMREVCPIHGWVGRFVFARDGHDACARIEASEACHICDGRKVVAGGFCRYCGGTGIDRPRIGGHDESPSAANEPDMVQAEASFPGRGHNPRRRARPRARTIAQKRITRESLRIGALLYPAIDSDERPRTRGECGIQRPCPFVSCRHNLYLDVLETGNLKLNFPELEPEDMVHSCALDEADKGPHTLEAVGEKLNVTRSRLRQIEVATLQLLRPVAEAEGIEEP